MPEPQRTLLLVEDEYIIAQSEKLVLESFGYRVLHAPSGERGVELAATESAIDLVLMDINLGKGIDGPEAAQRILKVRNLPVVFLTSHNEESYVNRVREITRYGYVIKDSGAFVLKSSIEMAFELWEAHDQSRQAMETAKIAEQHARQTEAIFDSFLEHCPILFFFKDAEIKSLKLSRNFEQLLGIPLEQAIGKSMDQLFPPDFAQKMIEDDKRILAEGKLASIEEEFGDRYYETTKFPVKVAGMPDMLAGFTIDITKRKLAEMENQQLLHQKELLLKEVHHRIRNNMQVIKSLISLQTEAVVDPVALSILADTISRIKSMEVLYEQLYQNERYIDVRADEYLKRLVDGVRNLLPNIAKVEIDIDILEVLLPGKMVFSLGILVNELLTNAIKHAFGPEKNGRISIKMWQEADLLKLVFRDDGCGIKLPGAGKNGFGLKLIDMLAVQLRGDLRVYNDNGSVWELDFKVQR